MFVVIKDMSAGNETIGEAWQETKIFEDTATLLEVMDWAASGDAIGYSRKRITLTKPH